MVLVGVWALILAVIRILRGGDFDLRLVPGVLALLLLAAAFGPGGMIGFSIMSQKAELASLLTAKGMLVDGKVVARSESSEENPLGTDAGRVRTIEWYLNTHRALGVLAPWFEGLPNDPFAPSKTPEETARDMLVVLGLRPDVGNTPGVAYFTHYSDMPAVVALPRDARVIGPVVFESGGPVPVAIPPQTVAVEGLGAVHLELADNLLTARLENGDEVKFDIRDAVKEIYRRGWPLTEDHRSHRQSELQLQGAGFRAHAFAHVAHSRPRRVRPAILPRPRRDGEASHRDRQARGMPARASSRRPCCCAGPFRVDERGP